MTFSAAGRATQVEVDGCQEMMRTETAGTLLRWTARPQRVDGKKIPFRVAIRINYREV